MEHLIIGILLSNLHLHTLESILEASNSLILANIVDIDLFCRLYPSKNTTKPLNSYFYGEYFQEICLKSRI